MAQHCNVARTVAVKFLQKGKLVYIEGKLRTRSFEDKEGVKKYTTEVVAENFTMLGRKSDFELDNTPRQSAKGPGNNGDALSDAADLPFLGGDANSELGK
jgi:single-strand DNA-binding protein